MQHHPNLVLVHSFGSRPEAELAKAALEDAGIPVMIQADTAGGMREHLAWSGEGFQIVVRDEDAADARDILKTITVESPQDSTSDQ
jgi:Putative prokaryotic signal transducing protein